MVSFIIQGFFHLKLFILALIFRTVKLCQDIITGEVKEENFQNKALTVAQVRKDVPSNRSGSVLKKNLKKLPTGTTL